MPLSWHSHAITRQRISTTIDPNLLARARALDPNGSDASMVERALRALLAQHRAAETDQMYTVGYATQPLDTPDEWGDLVSFGAAVRSAAKRA